MSHSTRVRGLKFEMANPSCGVSVSLEDLIRDAELAMNDPQTRGEFLNKTLNVFTNSLKSYFDTNEFRYSDQLYNWSLEELAKLKIDWYGGADLSKLHDLTAAALYGRYNFNGKQITFNQTGQQPVPRIHFAGIDDCFSGDRSIAGLGYAIPYSIHS